MGKEKEYFTIKAVHRDHLEELGFDAAAVDDSTMQELANILEEIYCEVRFWSDLKAIAEDLGIAKKKEQ
ncbi:hypothetical protein MYX76_15575 [Desulfobacterota bacterium AH_259_B03_O07]|nr:hypothetical protein [Desulfobacterota bacterium AH_259_B03_O07]